MTTRATPRLVATRYHPLEEYDHLIRFGISIEEIARQLGIKPASLQRSLLRRRRRVAGGV
jgi:transposase-like protein